MKFWVAKGFARSLGAAAVFIAFAAQGADMYSAAPARPALGEPQFWPGFYVGINGGYGWGARGDLTATAWQWANTFTYAQSSQLPSDGLLGGGQIAYLTQHGRFVFGLEADFQGADIKGDAHVQAVNQNIGSNFGNGAGYVFTDAWAQSNLDWFGTVRLRAGYTALSSLFYVTGGFAYGGARDSLRQSVLSTDVPPYTTPYTGTPVTASTSQNSTLAGYAIGGGIETALSGSWSVKAEYLHIDLGSKTLSTTSGDSITYPYDYNNYCGNVGGNCIDRGTASADVKHVYDAFRLGLNYRFNQPYDPLK
jgi:outer membrane immunogenic protein